MNNWRLLLFAVLCTFQPILSDENLFNGRERCFLRHPDFSRRDTRLLEYQYLSSSIPENRQLNTRKSQVISERNIERHDFRSSERELRNRDERLDEDVRKINRRTQVSLVSREKHNRETINRNDQRVDRHSFSRNERKESQIRNIRDEEHIDIEIRRNRLTRNQETNARFSRSQVNADDRLTYERDEAKTRSLLFRNTESDNIPSRRINNQRQLENFHNQPARNNKRIVRNVNFLERRAIGQRDVLERRDYRIELTARSVNDRFINVDESSRRNKERLYPQTQRDVRQTMQQNIRTESDIRAYNDEFNNHRGISVKVIDFSENNIRRSDSRFRRSHNEYKLQNSYRLNLYRVRRGTFSLNRRTNRGEQVRQNMDAARDSTAGVEHEVEQMRLNKVAARESTTRLVRAEEQTHLKKVGTTDSTARAIREEEQMRLKKVGGRGSNTRNEREEVQMRLKKARGFTARVVREEQIQLSKAGVRDPTPRVVREEEQTRLNKAGARHTITRDVRKEEQVRLNKAGARDSTSRVEREVEQMRLKKAGARDSTARDVRTERKLSVNNIRNSNVINRNTASDRKLSMRSQRQLSLEIQNKMKREIMARDNRIDSINFNRIVNDQRTQENRNIIRDNERRTSTMLKRQINSEDFRNIKNNQQRFTRDESRMTIIGNSFRQNMERGNDQRLRMIENIRINRADIKYIDNRGITSVTRDNRFFNKNDREGNMDSRRTDLFAVSRDMPYEAVLTFKFEIQHLLHLIQAIYLLGLFIKLPQTKEGFEKKTRMNIWNNAPKVIKVD